jgi:hypothetical protein
MISIIYPTARGLFPMKGALGQYDLLAQCLAEQSFADYEVVVVDATNTLPRPEIEFAVRKSSGGVRFLRPRPTPWTRMGAFAPNAARNTALCYARGNTIVAVDDCFVFKPHFLARIAELAERGDYAVPLLSQADNSVAYPERPTGPFPANAYAGGIIAYPLAAAVAVNGMDERLDGGSCGDIDFFARLRLHMTATGAGRFVSDPGVAVVGYGHSGRTLAHPRCERLGWFLAQRRWERSLRANEPWSTAELETWVTCGREQTPRVCSLSGAPCDYDKSEPEAVAMVRTGYECQPWFNLAEERNKNGLT